MRRPALLGVYGIWKKEINNNREETADGENLIQYRIPPTQCRAEYQWILKEAGNSDIDIGFS